MTHLWRASSLQHKRCVGLAISAFPLAKLLSACCAVCKCGDERRGRTRSGSVPTDKLFTGHQQEGSLYFMQARFYDPTLGRFLSPDSIVPGTLTSSETRLTRRLVACCSSN